MHEKRFIVMEPKDSTKNKLLEYDSQQEEPLIDHPNLYNSINNSFPNVNPSKIITTL